MPPRKNSWLLGARTMWEPAAVVAFWLLVACVVLVSRALSASRLSLHTVATTAVEYGPWLILTPIVFWLTRRLPLRGRGWPKRLALHVLIGLLTSVGLQSFHSVAIPALGPPRLGESGDRPTAATPPPPQLASHPPVGRPDHQSRACRFTARIICLSRRRFLQGHQRFMLKSDSAWPKPQHSGP